MTIVKLRPDHTLSRLTVEQQAQLYDWIATLGCPQAQVRLAKPDPDGFGLTAHITTLRRFYRHYAAALNVQELAESQDLPAQNSSSGSRSLLTGAEEAMHHAAFQFSTAPLDIETFNQLNRWLTKQKSFEQKGEYLRIAREHLALARERLELERVKFQFNASRQALLKLPELNKIMADTATDDEDKIWAARQQLFGLPPPSHDLNFSLNLTPPLPAPGAAKNNRSSIVDHQCSPPNPPASPDPASNCEG